MKKILLSAVFALFLMGITVPAVCAVGKNVIGIDKDNYVYLFAGLDDAAENTDSLILISYDARENKAALMQIPRDTYVNCQTKTNKINSIYSSARAEGSTSAKAMSRLISVISRQLGLSIDGYVAMTVNGVSELVDRMGGITVTLDEDFILYDDDGEVLLSLPKGENHINGKDAAILVRHRRTYKDGDLGRLDAQKIFLRGFFDTLLKRIPLDGMLRVIAKMKDSIQTNLSLRDSLIMVLKHSSKFRDTLVSYLRAPGKALRSENGQWYYAINKEGMTEALTMFFDTYNGAFDPDKLFLKDEENFIKIYNSGDFSLDDHIS